MGPAAKHPVEVLFQLGPIALQSKGSDTHTWDVGLAVFQLGGSQPVSNVFFQILNVRPL